MAIVYSTGVGRICPGCRRPAPECVCRDTKGRSLAPTVAPVRVSRQVQGRGGKAVSVITGLPLEAGALAQLAGELKRRCGSGGTVREGCIEIQGEHRDTLVAELAKRGYEAKKSGG
jgi:translation initiation factor 1